MIKLPEHFPDDQLSSIDRIQVEWFYTKYTDEYYDDYKFGHFLMAAYAAVPAYLTPDLLYKLWQNFGEYKWQGSATYIHPISVNDILLAPFCHEVSYELYKMDENTRLSFLKWMTSGDQLWESLQPHSLVEIAEFIESYHNHPNDTMVREGARYREDQLMEVKVYKDPQEVASFYLEKLRKALTDKNEQEILNLISSLKKAIKKESYTRYASTVTLGNLFRENQLELWRNVIQQNNSAIAELMEQVSQEHADGNLIRLTGLESSHVIHIKQTETKLVNRFNALVNPVNHAFLIGCSKEDEANCRLVEQTLKKLPGKDGWNIRTFTGELSRDELLGQLGNAIAAVTTNDNVVIYLSAYKAVSTSAGNCQVMYYDSGIMDIEFNRIISAVESPASLTMVIDCDHAATPNWLNTDKPGCAVFTATSREEAGAKLKDSTYTRAFCKVLGWHQGNVSNRQLYLEVIHELESFGWKTSSRLHSNRKTYYRRFGSSEITSVLLQHNLRLTGYLHIANGTEWNDEAETALVKFAKDHKQAKDAPNISEQIAARVEANEKERKPILLFIFTDADKVLQAMAREMHAIKTSIRNSPLYEHTEIKVFQNRPLKEVNDFVQNENTRNRIRMIYYSGFDHEGHPRFPDGVIELPMWNEWLAFHNNLEMVVLNTCDSELLAARLAQTGVGMAIGCHGKITDEEGANFGTDFIKAMAERRSLSSLQMQKG